MTKETQTKIRAISLTMSKDELKRLDDYCRRQRMATGDPYRRTEVIRAAIDRMTGYQPAST